MKKQTSRLGLRISEKLYQDISEAVKNRGYANPCSFVRTAVENELSDRHGALLGVEERMAATIEQVRREIFRVARGQQALFAFVDSLAKVLLTCLPEPSGDVMNAAVARARNRHYRLLKSAGQAMVGDSQAAMDDLVRSGE
jgi:Arc/MetJ-type ribon-helix-helix transcriptional regulator